MCTLEKLTDTQKQISPPAVRFSPRLWSLFTSASVPPSEPLFLLHSPSVTFHAFLLPYLPFCARFLFFPLPTQSLIKCFIMSLNKVKCSISLFLLHLVSLASVASQRWVLPPVSCMQPHWNTKPSLIFPLFYFFPPLCGVSKLIGHLWRLDCLSPVVPPEPLKFTSFIIGFRLGCTLEEKTWMHYDGMSSEQSMWPILKVAFLTCYWLAP